MKICSSVLWHLSLTDGVGPATAIRLLKSVCGLLLADLAEASQFKLDLISKIFSFSAHDFVMRCGLSQRAAEACVRGLADASLLHSEGELALRHGVHVVTLADAEYPQLLRNIHRPPIVLYIKGAKLKETPSIAVVGTRRANHYARRALELVVPELAASGWSVVSGGAVGVDTVAHELAIECRGHTAVVLGSGLLRPYPSTNKKLFESVVASGGSVVSPFPLEAPPEKGNFPARNRVVAGLAKSCLVVQAPGRSGALITASYALAENRDVYAVPGAVDDVLSQGCHDLIRQGAMPVFSARDILGEANVVQANLPAFVSKESVAVNGFESKLASAHAVDELQGAGDQEDPNISSKLFDLQICGKVKQNLSGVWERA